MIHKPCEQGCRAFSISDRGDCDCVVGHEKVSCECCGREVERRVLQTKRLWAGEWKWSCGLCPYWTVIVPFVEPHLQTEWHPTEEKGPFAVLTRGAFATEALAHDWARAHLGPSPYTTRLIDDAQVAS